jgi:hypothetical protein
MVLPLSVNRQCQYQGWAQEVWLGVGLGGLWHHQPLHRLLVLLLELRQVQCWELPLGRHRHQPPLLLHRLLVLLLELQQVQMWELLLGRHHHRQPLLLAA